MRPNGQCSARSSAICIAHSRRGVSALSSANLRSARSNGPAILLQGLCALVAIAMVHCNSRLTCAIALAIFAIGIAVSVLTDRRLQPSVTGEFSVGPQLLQQVIASEPTR